VLHKALKDAERLGLIVRNPASAASAPRATRPEFTTWSSDDAREFFDAIASHRLRVAYLLLVTTGMRRGEALGLRWNDLDLDDRQLAVVQTLNSINGQLVFSAPKTARSRRTVFLDPTTVEGLRSHRKRQAAERLAIGGDWDSSSNLVFRDEVGGPVKPDWFSREFDRLVQATGLPRLRLHDLRHTYATLALKAGIHPRQVGSDARRDGGLLRDSGVSKAVG
jgi:integrase